MYIDDIVNIIKKTLRMALTQQQTASAFLPLPLKTPIAIDIAIAIPTAANWLLSTSPMPSKINEQYFVEY